MADTQRTRSALEALFPDGTSQAISVQDLRDFLYSAQMRNPAVEQTGNHTLTLADADGTVVLNSASAQTVTVPTNAAVPFLVGTRIRLFRKGAGLPTLSSGGSPTAVFLRMPALITPNRFMGVKVKKSADQTAVDYGSGGLDVTFDSEIYDTDSFHDTVTNNERLTIPTGLGIRRVALSANMYFSAGLAGDNLVRIVIEKNGSAAWDGIGAQDNGATSSEGAVNLAIPSVSVTDGDYFNLFGQISGDTSHDVAANRTHIGLKVTEIAPRGSIAYRYGFIEIEKIGTDEWLVSGPALG